MQGAAIPIGLDIGMGAAQEVKRLLNPKTEVQGLPGGIETEHLYYPRTLIQSMQPDILGALAGGYGAKRLVDLMWGEHKPQWFEKHVPYWKRKKP